MASKKKNYAGKQYAKTREKGRVNLKRTEQGTLINQNNVEFTLEEKKRLEQAVNTANRKRKRMLEAAATLPRKIYGVVVDDNNAAVQSYGKESDFILAHKTKSLHRFKSKDEYERYMRNLERVNSRNYVRDRIELYRNNFTRSLLETYGAEAQDIVDHVNKMSFKEYMEAVESDEGLEISFVPSDEKYAGRLNGIRAALKIPLQEEWNDEVYE